MGAMTEINVRFYRPKDASALVEIFGEAVHGITGGIYTLEALQAWAPTAPDLLLWQRRFSQAPPQVAEVSGHIVGFMTLEPDGHIDLAYVHPAYQRQGVARRLYAAMENEANEQRLHRLFVEASHVARPFFSSRGFVNLRQNEVFRRGQRLSNWVMEKRMGSWLGRRHTFVIGNAGSGKTTLAKLLAEGSGLRCVELDSVAFRDGTSERKALESSLSLLAPKLATATVTEGCFADIMRALVTPDDHLLWLDLPVETCVAQAQARGWESHKWSSPQQQDYFLPQLLEFIRRYPHDSSPTGRSAHEALFLEFPGSKEKHVEPVTLEAVVPGSQKQ